LKPRAAVIMLASALARTAREDASDARDVRWQRWQGDRSILAAGGGGGSADTMMALTRQGQGDDGAGPAQARQGQCNKGSTTELMRERANG
jgi:hypothetical protein